MNVVIYARFSSHSQTEQSIEGQLKVCYAYAEANNMNVIGEYIDRAQTGTNDNRPSLQRMLSDSDKHTFEGVIVYQLDRFARNRFDSAINKAKLKKNGVRVISAKENIADDPSGILVEGVLESMAEYYSAELSQKIRRGMDINAEKCLSNGSNPGLGYIVNPDKTFSVDPEGAATVKEIFERYCAGESKTSIVKDMQRRGVKTSIKKNFSINSLNTMLTNKRYIGYYIYKDSEKPNGMPKIIDDDLFYRVQEILDKNKRAPARTQGEGEYLLTTKLFCGYCKEMMIGYGGTGKAGKQYHYYICKKARRKQCHKKIISKALIEDIVIKACLSMLTKENCKFIASQVSKFCANDSENLAIKNLKAAIKSIDNAIENLWSSIERGENTEMITERINARTAEKEKLLIELAKEENKCTVLTENQIMAFLDYVMHLPEDDINKRRAIINIFVNAIYLYDDHFDIVFNASNQMMDVKNIPIDDIEATFKSRQDNSYGCSSMENTAPPKTRSRHLCLFFVFL